MSSDSTVSVARWSDPASELVAPGVHRMPLPLPDELAAVNVYALERADGLTLVDAGQALRRCRSQLEESLAAIGYGLRDVREFLVTHAHRDHYTLATQVREEFGTTVSLGIREAASVTALSDPGWKAFRSQLAELRRNGADELADRVAQEASGQGMELELWAAPDRWILDDEEISVGTRRLRAIHTPGHTQGHVVFHDADQALLFAGDHVLPHITPSIGLEPIPGRSPLADFLASLRRVRMLPDTLLLPAHGPVSPSSHARVDELLLFHDDRLGAIVQRVDEGRSTGLDVARSLGWTRREISYDTMPAFHQMLAIVETAAHLRVLVEQSRIVEATVDGVHRYSALEVRHG
ncbi:MBL fold metallo-hydrolase [Nocardioides endophyticus]|uniref:MBL fold metallo-hydrolase n=1 Tax=Nocardioides endophyticus TaxID=1353775 RepID=A0ABP8YGI4_9ACTN